MNINAINNFNNTKYNLAHRGTKPKGTDITYVIEKTADVIESTTENAGTKQPFKIPEKIQKFAKKTYEFVIKVLDTF